MVAACGSPVEAAARGGVTRKYLRRCLRLNDTSVRYLMSKVASVTSPAEVSLELPSSEVCHTSCS